MPDHEPAREYIHAMIGHRTRSSEAERDALHQLHNTPAVRARFPSLNREKLCAIADSLVGQALPTPSRHVSAERARHAAFLFLHGHTPRLLLSGGGPGDDGRSEAEHMAAVAQACGVPPEALLLESQSRTTVENLSFAVSLLARQILLDTIRVVHLVSCPWHMRRVLHLANVAFGPGVRLLASPQEEGCTAST
jgi:hypothetical protein